jgi:hypothetical protein
MNYLPYSSDLAPCDFFRVGYLKQKLAGRSGGASSALLVAVLAENTLTERFSSACLLFVPGNHVPRFWDNFKCPVSMFNSSK